MNAVSAAYVLIATSTALLPQTATRPAGPARQGRVLHGRLVKPREGFDDPVANANVTLEQTGRMVTSNSAGLFFMPLPEEMREGEEITFRIAVPNYAVFQPVDGRVRIPRESDRDVITFELLPQGSPKFLSHEHLVALLKGAAEKSTEQIRERKGDNPPPDLSRYLKEWAGQFGFGLEQVQAEVERWVAEVERKQDDIYQLGLAAFAKKNFARAGSLFEESATQKSAKLKEVQVQEAKLYEEAIRDYVLAGDARFSAFLQALGYSH